MPSTHMHVFLYMYTYGKSQGTSSQVFPGSLLCAPSPHRQVMGLQVGPELVSIAAG